MSRKYFCKKVHLSLQRGDPGRYINDIHPEAVINSIVQANGDIHKRKSFHEKRE